MHRPYTFSPDYWTLGILIHEMVTGDAPYDRTYRLHSNTNETESIESEDDYPSKSTLENDTSDIIRPSSKHYNM
jgi:serine/threonine protein kinase